MIWLRRLPSLLASPAALLTVCVAASLCLAPAAQAADPAEILRLHETGQSSQALEQADAHLRQHPQDAQMRFVRANLLAATGDSAQARAELQELTRQHPELAEPWNNLAVLHAAAGELEEAEQALHAALRVQPDYATALDNLGEVQLQIALRHWQQAQQLAPSNARLKARIQALQELLTQP